MISQVYTRFLHSSSKQAFATAVSHAKQANLSAADETYLKEVRARYVTPNAENWAYLEYKQNPIATLSHFDHKSKDYVHSEIDEYYANVTTNSHNQLVDQFKRNLATQRKVNDILTKMDRPYLRGVPGITRNVSAGLQDYSTPVAHAKSQSDPNSFYADAYRNENRWIDSSIFTAKTSKMTHIDVEWPKELANRPVTSKFHHDKGYKYDVATPYDQRYNYVADRLGHPEILGSPFERLMRLEGDIYHPNFLDQPFVKIPSPNASTSLSFEEGEVLYENTRLLEWAKFWNFSVVVGYLWCAYFIPYNVIFKTHMPLEHAFDNLFYPYYQHTHFFWDNNALHIPTVGGVAIYATYIALSYINNIWKDYVVRAQFSKDRELLFVTRVSPFGSTSEEVYEVAHLEHLPPSVKSGVKDLSAQDKDGLVDITCLASQRSLVFYNGDNYWNPTARQQFVAQTSNLWTKNYTGYNRVESIDAVEKVQVGFSQTDAPKLEKK